MKFQKVSTDFICWEKHSRLIMYIFSDPYSFIVLYKILSLNGDCYENITYYSGKRKMEKGKGLLDIQRLTYYGRIKKLGNQGLESGQR